MRKGYGDEESLGIDAMGWGGKTDGWMCGLAILPGAFEMTQAFYCGLLRSRQVTK